MKPGPVDRVFYFDNGNHRLRRNHNPLYSIERGISVRVVNQNVALLGKTAHAVDDEALLHTDRPGRWSLRNWRSTASASGRVVAGDVHLGLGDLAVQFLTSDSCLKVSRNADGCRRPSPIDCRYDAPSRQDAAALAVENPQRSILRHQRSSLQKITNVPVHRCLSLEDDVTAGCLHVA